MQKTKSPAELEEQILHLTFCNSVLKETNKVVILHNEMLLRQVREKDGELVVHRLRNSN